jgi:hypothetical protein
MNVGLFCYLNVSDIKGLCLRQAENSKLFGSIRLAEEDVRSRTEHDFRYAVAFAWPRLGLPTSRVLIRTLRVALHLGFPEKLRGFTVAYPCRVLEIADRRAMDPIWDLGEAALE